MAVRLGSNPEVLCPAVDRAMTRGLRASRCKVLVTLPGGEHGEVLLPDGQLGFGFDGTRCHMNLEATAPELRGLLKPKDVPEQAIDRVNAYLSQARRGTPLHFDTRCVWIVQLVGTKLWMVCGTPAVQRPHRNCVAPPDSPWVDYDGTRLRVPSAPADFVVALLHPGDWLFVPKAAWHATYTSKGSISATLAAPELFEEHDTRPSVAGASCGVHPTRVRMQKG